MGYYEGFGQAELPGWRDGGLVLVSCQFKVMTEPSKVRYVARLIYERTSRVIGLNVVYLLMFNTHDTKHVCERERERP